MKERRCFSCGVKWGSTRVICSECGTIHPLCTKCYLRCDRHLSARFCSHCPTKERMVAKVLEGWK